ncbi:MAG TPA: tripartite tricarboxylate transporter TctB family protein [Candidatus Caccocola faecipullorum]|nr:tripartite tricarboxylate transporter TctB family protein [Candidatus Caccocola faecipullorum]
MLGIGVIAVSSTYPTAESYGTGVPGPGLWPMAIAIVLLACSAMLLYNTWRMKPEKNTDIDLFGPGPKRAYISMAILVVYVLLLEPLGFIIATTILEFIFIRWFSKKSYVVSFVIAAAVTAVVYGIFQFVLNVPVGSFGLIRL